MMKMRSFLNILLLLLLCTITIKAIPTLRKRQDDTSVSSTPDINHDILTPLKPLPSTPEPITRYYNMTLSRTKLAPDGFTRLVWTSNGQYPGPTIRANKGDRLVINIVNNLEDYTTIHWHGIFQVGSTYYDGVSGQTQCPIPNGMSFVYNFTTGEQYGTYWWHAHYFAQYADGVRGSLIIHDPNDPYLKDYDEEFLLTVSDWHHTESSKLIEMRMKPDYGGYNPIPDSGLISGRGRYDCSKAPPGSECIPNNPYAVYVIEKGKRYRFRIINTSAEATYTFSIDEHPLRVIEVEGENVKAIVLNKINIAVGQRYSVIVTADKEVKNFWIRATIIKQCLHSNPRTININSAINYKVVGILRYQGAPEEDPNTQEYDDPMINCRDVDHNLLKLYHNRPAPDPPTDFLVLNISFIHQNRTGYATVNKQIFDPDEENPTVNKIMYGGDMDAYELEKDLDQAALVYDTENGVVQITLRNENPAHHPFHLHGHNFFILGHGDLNNYPPDPSQFNLVDPAVRDTVTVLPNSWTVIRYRIDNPGVWAFHCHIEWHVEMGMVGQLIERPSVLKNTVIPPEVLAICPKSEEKR